MLFKVTRKKFYQVDVEVIHEHKHLDEFGEVTLFVNNNNEVMRYATKSGITLMRLKEVDRKPVYLVDHRLLRILKRR